MKRPEIFGPFCFEHAAALEGQIGVGDLLAVLAASPEALLGACAADSSATGIVPLQDGRRHA